jgi:hypothetical protein
MAGAPRPGQFRPGELDAADLGPGIEAELLGAARELEWLARREDVGPGPDFVETVMAAVSREPGPRPVAAALGAAGRRSPLAALAALGDLWRVAFTGGRPLAARFPSDGARRAARPRFGGRRSGRRRGAGRVAGPEPGGHAQPVSLDVRVPVAGAVGQPVALAVADRKRIARGERTARALREPGTVRYPRAVGDPDPDATDRHPPTDQQADPDAGGHGHARVIPEPVAERGPEPEHHAAADGNARFQLGSRRRRRIGKGSPNSPAGAGRAPARLSACSPSSVRHASDPR